MVHVRDTHPRFLSPKRVVAELNLWEGDHVIDIHTGTGHFLPHVTEAVGARGRVYMRSTQVDMLKTLHREALRNGQTHVCMVPCTSPEDDIDLDAGTLDVALLVQAQRYIDSDTLLSEIARVIRREGKLCVIDWHMDPCSDNAPAPTERAENDTEQPKPTWKEQLIARLASFGFAPKRELTSNAVGSYHYGIIFTRV